MFEVTGADIQALNDVDLRTLVTRLALAELNSRDLPVSGVTAGGHQNAADGGLDVRVEVPVPMTRADFVPRSPTGFQVKKPDMPPGAIVQEMRPGGTLRSVIGELAAAGGAYIIVSAQGTTADARLRERREAMQEAARTNPNARHLHCDFYDRERVATWANQYPGVAVWVRSRVGRELSGWRPIGNWTGDVVDEGTPYLADDKACLVDERSHERKKLRILEGIAALRSALAEPRRATRLIGLSGLGKTRLVQALFETGVAGPPLDPALAVYTDYSEETTPTAHEMARRLVDTNQRAILIVDNCNPETHADLARICAGDRGRASLLTVEYDVRDDEPERTEVFRLESASPELVENWLKQGFPHISQIDRSRIATFSDGNFRVARALAETLKRGETLGQLKDRALFERIFRQRNEPDQQLLLAAEDLSLLYSFDGEDSGATSELGTLAALRAISPLDLFTAAVTLHRRGIAQARGRWRAVLPHAIANRLAAYALERIPADRFDNFCADLPARMQKSLSRRLGYLHDSEHARRAVARWMERDGPLGDLLAPGEANFQVLRNIAPAAPEIALARIEVEVTGPAGQNILDISNRRRNEWIGLLKSLAYDPGLFERATLSLARFVAAEPPRHNQNSAATAFGELFHYYLSGTQATPQQRREAIRRLSQEEDPGLKRAAGLALDELLEAAYFTSLSVHDFGARSRDFGWQPHLYGDIHSWIDEAITLCMELAVSLPDAGGILARNVRTLWLQASAREQLDRAATFFAKDGPWIDGWMSFRAALRYEGAAMPAEGRTRLLQIIDRLKPVDLINKARAVVLTRSGGGFDLIEGEEGDGAAAWQRASDQAASLGEAFAADPALLTTFVEELYAEESPQRAAEFGKGLAAGSERLEETWMLLVGTFRQMQEAAPNATVLGGFLAKTRERDGELVQRFLDEVSEDPALVAKLTFLQTRAGLDGRGVMRLMAALEGGKLDRWDLHQLVSGAVSDAPPEALAFLIVKIATTIEGGVMLGLDILGARFSFGKDDDAQANSFLVTAGRGHLINADFAHLGHLGSFGLKGVAKVCLSGSEGEEEARKLCRKLRVDLDGYGASPRKLGDLLETLFAIQPAIALDELLVGDVDSDRADLRLGRPTPLENVDTGVLRAWADLDPARRYPLIGEGLLLFGADDSDADASLSAKFLDVMEYAPDRAAFLGQPYDRLHPRSWSGSLAHILERRRDTLRDLASHSDGAVRTWVADVEKWIDQCVAAERKRESASEESFE